MIVDHVNALWFDHKIFWMLLAGRGTFPLFCYAVAVAVLKTEGRFPARYVTRMFLFAVAAEPFYYFAFGTPDGNVIFTLAAGALAAAFVRRVRLWQMYALYIGAAASMLLPFPVEFGLAGIMLPSAIVLALRGERSVLPFLILLLFSVNMGDFLNEIQKGISPAAWRAFFVIGVACVVLPAMALELAGNLRQTGRLLSKYALYVFYPAHLFLLKIIGLAFFR
ncbi:MAG: TraX family protein [Pseudomonadota bacterium]